MTREIVLTRGYTTMVDDADYDWLMQWKWHVLSSTGKPRAHRAMAGNRGHKILMSRVIANAPDGVLVDHINGDTLDNRRANLRLATSSQNMANQLPRSDTSSRYIGVTWHRKCGKWQAQVKHKGITKYLGLFSDELSAARVRDAAARSIWGPFVRCNFEVPA